MVQPYPKGAVHEAIQQASQNIPRYLFRTWHPGSGGDPELNTDTHIIPSAFKDDPKPDSVFDIDEEILHDTILQHLSNEPMKTFFSSWSPTLHTALTMARGPLFEAHIAILDTTQPPPHNNIHWCGSSAWSQFEFPRFALEYHVFGKVSGPADQAAPVEYLRGDSDLQDMSMATQGALGYLGTLLAKDTSERERFAEAVKVGKRIGGKFGLIMAVYLLCLPEDASPQQWIVDALLDEFNVPFHIADGLEDNWTGWDDQAWFMAPPELRQTEIVKANAVFRALRKRQLDRQGPAVATRSQEQRSDPDQGVQMADVQPPKQGVDIDKNGRPRVRLKLFSEVEGQTPKEVRDLEIDMEGEDEHNKQLGV